MFVEKVVTLFYSFLNQTEQGARVLSSNYHNTTIYTRSNCDHILKSFCNVFVRHYLVATIRLKFKDFRGFSRPLRYKMTELIENGIQNLDRNDLK